jgi:flagellar biosynthetic protein FliR
MLAPLQDLVALALPYALPTARAVGVVAFLPGLGGERVPPMVRLAIAGGVSLLAVSGIRPQVHPPSNPEAYMLALVSELALGLIVGWCVTVLLEAARWAGELLDVQIGFRTGETLDPVSAHSGAPIAQLYYLTAFTFFFVVDGHHWVLAALARSLERIPPGQVSFSSSALSLLLGCLTSSMDIAVRLCVAGTTALLLADLALAVVGRHVPQMNVFLVGIPAKIGSGLLVLAVSAPLLAWGLGQLISDLRQYVGALLGTG